MLVSAGHTPGIRDPCPHCPRNAAHPQIPDPATNPAEKTRQTVRSGAALLSPAREDQTPTEAAASLPPHPLSLLILSPSPSASTSECSGEATVAHPQARSGREAPLRQQLLG